METMQDSPVLPFPVTGGNQRDRLGPCRRRPTSAPAPQWESRRSDRGPEELGRGRIRCLAGGVTRARAGVCRRCSNWAMVSHRMCALPTANPDEHRSVGAGHGEGSPRPTFRCNDGYGVPASVAIRSTGVSAGGPWAARPQGVPGARDEVHSPAQRPAVRS